MWRLFPSLLRSFYPHLILTTWANHSRSATPTDRQKKSGRVRASYRYTRTYIRKYVYFPFKLRNVRAFLVRPSSGNHLIDRDVTAPFASHFFHPVFSIDLSFLTTEMFFFSLAYLLLLNRIFWKVFDCRVSLIYFISRISPVIINRSAFLLLPFFRSVGSCGPVGVL